MPVTLLKNADFSPAYAGLTGSLGVKYQVMDAVGNVVAGPTAAGVYEVFSGSGIYAAPVTFPDSFDGQVAWLCPATGALPPAYAVDEYHYLANNPRVDASWQMLNDVTGSVQGLYDVAFGRWKIDTATNRMLFYRTDGTTLVATFDLFDNNGTPTFDSVFERRLNGTVTP